MGFFMQILDICFYFTTISWNTGQFSTLVTMFQVMELVVSPLIYYVKLDFSNADSQYIVVLWPIFLIL